MHVNEKSLVGCGDRQGFKNCDNGRRQPNGTINVDTEHPTPRESALRLHDSGFLVVPLCVGKKRLSLRKGELAKLTANPPGRQWVESQWPSKSRRNIGVRLGAVSRGAIARDFDDASEYQTWASYHADLAGSLPTVRTRRGFHVYLIDADGFTGSMDLRRFGAEGELKGDGTHVVGPGSMLSFSRDEKPIEPFAYTWAVPPPSAGMPQISLVESGLVPPNFSPAPNATQDTQGGAWSGGGVGEVYRLPAEPLAGPPLQNLVERHSITGRHQRRDALKQLAMSIIRQSAERPEGELRDRIFRSWWAANSQHCGTGEEMSWLEFDQMLDELRGDGFISDVRLAYGRVTVPGWADCMHLRQIGRDTARALAACDLVACGRPFHLSARTVQTLVGAPDHTTPYRNMQAFIRKGILQVVELGEAKPGGRATVYQLLLNSDGSVR